MRGLVRKAGKLVERVLLLMGMVCLLSVLITWMGMGKPSVFGFRPFFVMTGSMEPTIRARCIVMAVPVSPEEVREGDIVTYTRTAVDTSGGHFRIPFTVVHRVREIRDDTFIFQGDNESEPDPSVRAEQIGYRVVWIAEGL